jgi:hypothetical protein
MRPPWASLNERDRAACLATIAFLDGRLEERATIDWALRLIKATDTIKRLGLLCVIDSPAGQKISEPWRSAWRLVEESWSNPAVEDSTGAYDAQRRLRSGDRSGSLVTAIVELVAPRIRIERLSSLDLHFRKPPRRPRKVEDLFSMGLTSGEVIEPDVLDFGALSDRSFLVSLALALDVAVAQGLDTARRIGWCGEGDLWQLGGLGRVYYVPAAELADDEYEPDELHQGIAPSVKLLHAVISQLIKIDISVAVEHVHRWKLIDSPVYLRLWAALSRDSQVTPASEIGPALLSLNDRRFWNIHDYPEIAEVRARRFAELALHEQAAITARIRKGPPRNPRARNADPERVKTARVYRAVRELRRIELAGASLPKGDKAWLAARINAFPDLIQMVRLDDGFPRTPAASSVPPNPDRRYDLLAGEERLKGLEAALSSASGRWDDSPAERTSDWINEAGNACRVLGDLECALDGGSRFPRVWEQLGWSHKPPAEQDGNGAPPDLLGESHRVLLLLAKLPEATLRQAINGISHWLSAWEKWVVAQPEGLNVWLKLWPIAVEVTNTEQPGDEELETNITASSSDSPQSPKLDPLNTPVGKLVGVFLTACPTLRRGDAPFSDGSAQRKMRDLVGSSMGPSGLIVKYRLIEAFRYFLKADRDWTKANLVPPLLEDSDDGRRLWGAVARRRRYSDELQIIGDSMVDRAIDPRLHRETRRSLVFSLVVDCLHALREQAKPAISKDRVTQMIRLLDDEVRASAAETVQRFLRDVSATREGRQGSPSPEEVFRSAVDPFLRQVWPQEHSLVTPGVSRALADLPTTARGAFAEAVATIERLLTPFECWSLLDYGFRAEEGGGPSLLIVDGHRKAAALLRLLDLTIGTGEASVVPHDLADAMDRIQEISPHLVEDPAFRRLTTAVRRR